MGPVNTRKHLPPRGPSEKKQRKKERKKDGQAWRDNDGNDHTAVC